MDPQQRAASDSSSGESAGVALSAEALANADESERYRMLASFLSQFADRCRNGSSRSEASAEQTASLARKLAELEKRKADLEDQLRAAQADLAHRQRQLDAELARARELESVYTGQRARLETAEAQSGKLETELVNRNQDLHRLETENESLRLKLQRAQLVAGDTGRLDALEEEKRRLAAEVEESRAGMEQLRKDKNAEIDRLTADLTRVQGQSTSSADALLASLWQKLASAKPSLAEGHLQPTVQAAERLVDAFVELAGFVHKLDQDMRPNLDGFTRPDAELRRLWSVYKEQCDVCQTLRQTLAPVHGKHVGALKMQLKVCRNWVFAALVSSDSTVEWIADELRAHLLGPAGAAANPKCTLKEYVKMSGPEAFLEQMRQLRSRKLAEVYARGA